MQRLIELDLSQNAFTGKAQTHLPTTHIMPSAWLLGLQLDIHSPGAVLWGARWHTRSACCSKNMCPAWAHAQHGPCASPILS